MNAEELLEALKAKGLEKKELRVQFRDGGGAYSGEYDVIGDEDYGYMFYDEETDAVYL